MQISLLYEKSDEISPPDSKIHINIGAFKSLSRHILGNFGFLLRFKEFIGVLN